MAISETAQKCTKHYMEKAKIPDVFNPGDKTNFKLFLGLKFAIDMGEKDLDKHDMELYKDLKPLKQYIDNTLYKDTMNWGLLKISEGEAKQREKKAMKAAKKAKKKAKKEQEQTILDTPAPQGYYVKKSTSLLGRVIDAIQDKMLDFSIWVNDKLIEM